MSNQKILVILPENADLVSSGKSGCDVLVVRNVEQDAHRIRGWAVYRVLLIGVTQKELNPRIHDAYLAATSDFAAKYGERPKLQSV